MPRRHAAPRRAQLRDVGCGPGRRDPLTIRLHASTVFGWIAAIGVLGLALGALAPNIGDLLGSPSGRDMPAWIGGVEAAQDALLTAELSIVAIPVSCFAVTVITHRGAEEHDGRTEQVLATATRATASTAHCRQHWPRRLRCGLAPP